MVGRLYSNFRFGVFAEDLGVLMMKTLAAVAEVSRSEDVGVDAICSLLRPDEDGNQYAEDTFLVQIKSASTKKVEYRGIQCEWFRNQELPFFVGLASIDSSMMQLYPLFKPWQVACVHRPKSVKIRFGDGGWETDSDGSAIVWTGEPLLKWTVSDSRNREWRENSYQVLKEYLQFEHSLRHFSAYGQLLDVCWKTNTKGSCARSDGVSLNLCALQAIASDLSPILDSLMSNSIFVETASGAGAKIRQRIQDLVHSLREVGLDIDEGNRIENLYQAGKYGFPIPAKVDKQSKSDNGNDIGGK